MALWKFSIEGAVVQHGTSRRGKITGTGCNEPYKNRYWCPKLQWFRREPCPFVDKQECENYKKMCGAI